MERGTVSHVGRAGRCTSRAGGAVLYFTWRERGAISIVEWAGRYILRWGGQDAASYEFNMEPVSYKMAAHQKTYMGSLVRTFRKLSAGFCQWCFFDAAMYSPTPLNSLQVYCLKRDM